MKVKLIKAPKFAEVALKKKKSGGISMRTGIVMEFFLRSSLQ